MQINNKNRLSLFSEAQNSSIDKGGSVRHYNSTVKLVKKILEVFKIAVHIKLGGVDYLVNAKSLVQYKLRFKEMEKSAVNLQDKHNLLNLLYKDHKKVGYSNSSFKKELQLLNQYRNKEVNEFLDLEDYPTLPPFSSGYLPSSDEEEVLI